MPDLAERLWRARKRHDHVDAVLRDRPPELSFFYNDRLVLRRRYADVDAATADARVKLSELQRSGWNTHW